MAGAHAVSRLTATLGGRSSQGTYLGESCPLNTPIQWPGEPSINPWLRIIISRLVDRHLSRRRPLVTQWHTDDQVPAKGVQPWRPVRPDRKTGSPSERQMRMYQFAWLNGLCVRCRRLKIKCSGLQPCDGCSKRRVACELDQRDQKIVVTRG
ncbi:hypothetical protein BN1708_013375 [Verticillium longisporum]|uniref:Zn(2)-C6 fungal-type domain-containing protein n=1 Tax=Verticillium longisporum TaxID=100787 RepID=A0A0G4LJS3_VERLO|nr:hypothetical protein BN1708_013375 [Verticillium longisporum]